MNCGPQDFAIAVKILEIEHIPAATRIIIKYLLTRATANPDSPGWLYIANGTGYRGICQDTWICMTPNTQHPLHDNSIKHPGIYRYVWDYDGEFGLDPEDFDEDTSYVIQIALQDSGCTWSDPCVDDPNHVPGDPNTCSTVGDEVEGTVGEQGNCCDDWHIELDERGCPECIEDEDPGDPCDPCHEVPSDCPDAGDCVVGTVGQQGNCCEGYHIELDGDGCPFCVEDDDDGSGGGWGKLPPTAPAPPGKPPGGGGGGGGDGGVVWDKDDDWHGGGGLDNKFDDEHSEGGTNNAFTDDVPASVGPLDWGPVQPASNRDPAIRIDQETLTVGGEDLGTYVHGTFSSEWAQHTPDSIGGGGTYGSSSSEVGKGRYPLVKGNYGGKSRAYFGTNHFFINQRYNQQISEIVSNQRVIPSQKEFGITTRSFLMSTGPVLNAVPGSSPQRGKTRPTDAVVVKNNETFLKFKQEFRRTKGLVVREGITTGTSLTPMNVIQSTRKTLDLRGAKDNLSSKGKAIVKFRGTQSRVGVKGNFGSNVSIGQRGNTSTSSQFRELDFIKYRTAYRQDPTFLNNNTASLLVSPARVNVGGLVYASAFAYPLTEAKQTMRLALYIKDGTGQTRRVRKTGMATANFARRIAAEISTAGLRPGKAEVIFVAFNEAGTPVYTQTQRISLSDPGSVAAIPDSLHRRSGNTARSLDYSGTLFIKDLTDNQKLRIILGNNLKNVMLITQGKADVTLDSLNGNMRFGARCRDTLNATRQHHLSAWEESTVELIANTYISGTKYTESVPGQVSKIFDAPLYKYSASMYADIQESDLSNGLDSVMVNISLIGNNKRISTVDLELGGPIEFVPSNSATELDNGDGTWTITTDTPYAYTTMVAFTAGGNNNVPIGVLTTSDIAIGKNGQATYTLTIDKGAWYGLALAGPTNSPLSTRTFFYRQVGL